MKYIELGSACDTCVIAIANDDYSGASPEGEQATKEGILRIGQWLVVGEERGFEHNRCCVCGSFPGNRHEVGYLREATPEELVSDLIEDAERRAEEAQFSEWEGGL